MRAMDTAPAIALKMMKKFRSRSAALAPGINSNHLCSLISPEIRFRTAEFGASNLRRQCGHRASGIGMIAVLWREIEANEFLPSVFAWHRFQRGIELLAVRECLSNRFGEKFVLAPKVLVKSAHCQTGCFHYAGNVRTAQPFSAELASGVSDDALAGSRLVIWFITHMTVGLYA